MGGITMKYKVGDKVRVKSKEWYDENQDTYGNVPIKNYFVAGMSKWCGKEVTIDAVYDDSYRIKEDNNEWLWTNEMFEDGVVEQNGQRKFKCKDEVIITYKDEGSRWTYGIFSHETETHIALCGGFLFNKESVNVVPFAGNENLVGTVYEYISEEKTQLEVGTLVFCFDHISSFEELDMAVGKFERVLSEEIFISGCCWNYCIPFSKFNPDDLESTKKEILTVKNGKLVKANV